MSHLPPRSRALLPCLLVAGVALAACESRPVQTVYIPPAPQPVAAPMPSIPVLAAPGVALDEDVAALAPPPRVQDGGTNEPRKNTPPLASRGTNEPEPDVFVARGTYDPEVDGSMLGFRDTNEPGKNAPALAPGGTNEPEPGLPALLVSHDVNEPGPDGPVLAVLDTNEPEAPWGLALVQPGAGAGPACTEVLHRALDGSADEDIGQLLAVVTADSRTELEGELPIIPATAATDPSQPCLVVVGKAIPMPVPPARVITEATLHGTFPRRTKRVRNPERARLEKELKKAQKEEGKGFDIMRTGDPTIDLLGLAIGSVVSGIGAIMPDATLTELEAKLEATPEFLEEPIMEAYRYKLKDVEAKRSMRLPVALWDRRRGAMREDVITFTEQARFAISDDRHPQDPTPQHDPAARLVSTGAFEAWQSGLPALPTREVLVHLARADGPSEPAASLGAVLARLGDAAAPPLLADLGPEPLFDLDDEALAAIEPASAPAKPRRTRKASVRKASEASLLQMKDSIVQVGDGGRGFYVTRDQIVTSNVWLPSTSLVKVVAVDGRVVHGLIEERDDPTGLALIYVPRPGEPLPLAQLAVPPVARASLPPGSPVMDGDEVVGMALGEREVASAANIAALIERVGGR